MPTRATLLTLTLLAAAGVNAHDWQRQGIVEGNLPASPAAVESADDLLRTRGSLATTVILSNGDSRLVRCFGSLC